MRNLTVRLFVSMLVLLTFSAAQAQSLTADEAYAKIQGVAKALDGLATVSGRAKRTERVKGSMETGDLRFKVNVKPLKIYIINVKPNEGTELIYIPTWNDGKVYIHPNQFPWVNISMDSYGSQMLKDQHHHITSTGFVTVQNALKKFLSKSPETAKKELSYAGQEKWYGKMLDVYKIVSSNYKFETYKVLPGEDMIKIDQKLHVPSFKLLELNPECDDYFDLKPGQVIKVPSDFAKEIVLMVDPVTQMPIVQIFIDDKGLFEKYEMSELKLNPKFGPLEFSDENEAYGF